MKKNILFVIDSLHCAGAEKSLINLLSLIDGSKYNIDLQLFGYGGALEEMLPKNINLLEPLNYTKFTEKTLKEGLLYSIKKLNFKMLFYRVKYSIELRKSKCDDIEIARIYWENATRVIDEYDKNYDIAISYAQGIPTFYVADKISADKKFAWINTSYKLNDKEKLFQEKFYQKYKNIVTVSESAKQIFLENYPKYKDRIRVIFDINNYEFIKNMSLMNNEYTDEYKGIKILTIGRLVECKGYDIALDACKELVKRKIDFKWYVLGDGGLSEEIKLYIDKNNLKDKFILLGVKYNPYPYIKDCDIYVQTSRFEGFGLAIAEARMLNKPVVATRFDSVYNQMINEKNGLVVEMNGNAVADGIERLINDSKLNESIVRYLEKEKKGNVEEIAKFYRLIENI